MKRSDLTIVAIVGALLLVALFWFLLLAPKRHEAADLQSQIDDLRASVEQKQQEATLAEDARDTFPSDYRKLVVLGKAVPDDSDQPSLVVELQNLANRAGVQFDDVVLSGTPGETTSSSAPSSGSDGQVSAAPQAAGSAGSPSPPAGGSSSPVPTSTSTGGGTSSSSTASTSSSSGSVPAEPAPAPTEATAASLPLGANIGPAGLPIMPYTLSFTGNYFGIADFLKSLDGMVHAHNGKVSARGRLLTVDGFTLAPPEDTTGVTTTPTSATGTELQADFSVTAYLTPPDQGATAGASASGPAPGTPSPTTPTPTSGTGTTPTATQTSSPAPAP